MLIFLTTYSEKSVAVFGDTKEYSSELKEKGGRFNPNLTYEGVKKPGWIFSNKKKEELEQFIDIVNKGEYKRVINNVDDEKINNYIQDLKKIRYDIDRLIVKYEGK
jgi:hypothetical protein